MRAGVVRSGVTDNGISGGAGCGPEGSRIRVSRETESATDRGIARAAFLLITLVLSVGMGAVFTLVRMCEDPYCLWETGDE